MEAEGAPGTLYAPGHGKWHDESTRSEGLGCHQYAVPSQPTRQNAAERYAGARALTTRKRLPAESLLGGSCENLTAGPGAIRQRDHMTHARKPRRSAKSRGKGAKAPSNPNPSAKQLRYIEWLREQYDPLSSGSEMPTTKVATGAEIAHLLNLKAKYETMTRQPSERKPRGSGQFRYP